MVKLRTDLNRCIKAGECYSKYPDLFASEDDGFPRVRTEEPKGEELDDAEDAVRGCPSNAITLRG